MTLAGANTGAKMRRLGKTIEWMLFDRLDNYHGGHSLMVAVSKLIILLMPSKFEIIICFF